MKDNELRFDRTCHVLYTKQCKKEIQEKIALHYPVEQRGAVWERVQLQYVDYLKDWRTDLGGKKNFHNGAGGTYDCIALMAYYTVCREVTSLAEIEESLPPGFQAAAICRREQAAYQEAFVQGVPEREEAMRQMGRLQDEHRAL